MPPTLRTRAAAVLDMDIAKDAIQNGTETEIHALFKQLCAFFKNDTDRLATWFFAKASPMIDTNKWRHRYLMSWVFQTVGLKNDDVKAYLDTVPDGPILSWMGVNRVKGKNGVHYRTRTGMSTNQVDL